MKQYRIASYVRKKSVAFVALEEADQNELAGLVNCASMSKVANGDRPLVKVSDQKSVADYLAAKGWVAA